MSESPSPDRPKADNQSSDVSKQSLARKLSRRATDLFAIAILAVGVLSVSGRLTDWWATSPDDVLRTDQSVAQIVGSQISWGAGETPVALRLGQLPVVMHRQIIVGDETRAQAVASERCRSILRQVSAEKLAVDNAERDLVKKLKDQKPVDEQKGHWQLFRIDQSQAMMVGTLLFGIRQQTASQLADGDDLELVCWAMVVPKGDAQWGVFVFEKSSSPISAVVNVPLPGGATIVFSMTDPSGGQLASFESGELTVDSRRVAAEWRDYWDRELASRMWRPTREWERISNGWAARFESPESICEIILNPKDDRLRGLATLTPKSSSK